MEEKFIMSFVDKSVKVNQYGNRTIASVVSGLKFSKFDNILSKFGLDTVPTFIENILEFYGYKRDYSLGMWVIKTTGVAKCSEGDDFDEVKGRRIALSRAKMKAYDTLALVMGEIVNTFYNVEDLFVNTLNAMVDFSVNEEEAIENVITTGYSKPRK